MSKERARRRAERQAATEAARAARERKARRRQRRRALLRRLVPRLPDRRTGKLFARRSRSERAAIALAVSIALVVIWRYVDSLSMRVAFTLLIAATTPMLVILTLDRRI